MDKIIVKTDNKIISKHQNTPIGIKNAYKKGSLLCKEDNSGVIRIDVNNEVLSVNEFMNKYLYKYWKYDYYLKEYIKIKK